MSKTIQTTDTWVRKTLRHEKDLQNSAAFVGLVTGLFLGICVALFYIKLTDGPRTSECAEPEERPVELSAAVRLP